MLPAVLYSAVSTWTWTLHASKLLCCILLLLMFLALLYIILNTKDKSMQYMTKLNGGHQANILNELLHQPRKWLAKKFLSTFSLFQSEDFQASQS